MTIKSWTIITVTKETDFFPPHKSYTNRESDYEQRMWPHASSHSLGLANIHEVLSLSWQLCGGFFACRHADRLTLTACSTLLKHSKKVHSCSLSTSSPHSHTPVQIPECYDLWLRKNKSPLHLKENTLQDRGKYFVTFNLHEKFMTRASSVLMFKAAVVGRGHPSNLVEAVMRKERVNSFPRAIIPLQTTLPLIFRRKLQNHILIQDGLN